MAKTSLNEADMLHSECMRVFYEHRITPTMWEITPNPVDGSHGDAHGDMHSDTTPRHPHADTAVYDTQPPPPSPPLIGGLVKISKLIKKEWWG